MTIGAGGGWWAAARLGQQVDLVNHAVRTTQERLWDARLAQARAGRASRLPGQRFNSLDAIAEAARIRPTRELRNEAIACLALPDVQVEREWLAELETDRLEYSTGVAFDATLEHYACTAADGTVSIWKAAEEMVPRPPTVAEADGIASAVLASGEHPIIRLAGKDGPADFLRFSPNGRYLATAYSTMEHPYRVWDWRLGKVVFERPKSPSIILSMDFLPDGTSMVVGGAQELQTIALGSGKVLGTIPLDIPPGWIAVSPGTGDFVAVCGRVASQLRIVELCSRRVVASWDNLPAELVAVAWHPSGPFLACSGRDGNLYTFDLESRSPPAVLRGHLLEARELSFSPDGTLLVSRGWDGTTRFWDPVGGQEVLRIRGTSFLQFDRNSHRLAYRGYNSRYLGIWQLADQTLCRILHHHRGRASQAHVGASFSPDSRLLATCAGEDVCLWDARTGRLLGRIATGPTTDVLFDPAGRYLYSTGSKDTYRCALTRSEDAAGVSWKVGRPTSLVWPFGTVNGFHLEVDRSGDRLAIVQRFLRVIVLPSPGREGRPVFLLNHPQVSYAALSPDGRFTATGTWRGQGVKVWETATGKLVCTLPARESPGVSFTPDGGRLLVLESEGTYRADRVGTWEQEWERHDPETGFTRGLRAALDATAGILAQVSDRINPRLDNLETGAELAVLPRQAQTWQACLSCEPVLGCWVEDRLQSLLACKLHDGGSARRIVSAT